MARIEFHRREEQSWMLDPKEDFAPKSMSLEIRKDFLTGHVSRILPYRFRLREGKLDREIIEASKKNCPFCPEKLASLTPKFVPEIIPEGRMRKGEATVFPNSFPYARYSFVVVLTEKHFLDLSEFTTERLKDGFLIAQEGIDRVKKREPTLRYSSMNWNYLPEAGAGLFHPHLQLVLGDQPTVFQQRVLEGLERYRSQHGTSYWEDYLREEREAKERYAGNIDRVHFLMAFSPAGVFGEIVILFAGKTDIKDLDGEDWESLSDGLRKIFYFLQTKHIQSFNFALFSGSREDDASWLYARLCPRAVIPPWNTSDINYFEKLHNEVICVVSPEEWCRELREWISSRNP